MKFSKQKQGLENIRQLSGSSLPFPSHIKPSKRKSTKSKDKAFKPSDEKKNRRSKSGNKENKNPYGRYKPSGGKIAILMRDTLLSPKTEKLIGKKIEEKIPHSTPISKVNFSETGSPDTVISRSGTVLHKETSNGLFITFTDNKPEQKSQHTSFPVTRSRAEKIKDIKEAPSDAKKEVNIHITRELLNEVAKMSKAYPNRKISQNKLMGGSATNYARCHGFSLDNAAEHAHIVARHFLSEVAQHHDNLVVTTKEANTEMLTIENIIAALIDYAPNGIDVNAIAHLHPGTHIAKKIDYKVTIGSYQFPFVFDGQQTVRPSQEGAEMIKIVFESIFMKKDAKERANLTDSPASNILTVPRKAEKSKVNRELKFFGKKRKHHSITPDEQPEVKNPQNKKQKLF